MTAKADATRTFELLQRCPHGHGRMMAGFQVVPDRGPTPRWEAYCMTCDHTTRLPGRPLPPEKT